MNLRKRWWLLVLAGVVCYCVLSFYRTGAAQTGTVPTLANAPKDRQEMIANLKEIKELLKEQNALLKSGQVKVVIVEEERK
ncbi:MAG: hypothetical protein JW959_13475 [Pirellulales bacterium]|nr:hypothetical protein [Pirellulales bacterium]